MLYLKKILCVALAAMMVLVGTACDVLLMPEISDDITTASTDPAEVTQSETEESETAAPATPVSFTITRENRYQIGFIGENPVIPSVFQYEGTTYLVTGIGEEAFSDCDNLISVTIPDSVTSIGGRAFFDCGKLTSIVIPNSVTSIGEAAFERCSGLTSITIPDSVTSIGARAFHRCSNLTSIVIPDSVTSIGDRAFSQCSNLTSIVIPDSVTSIGYGAFSGCSTLTDIYFTGTESEWEAITKGEEWDANTGSYTVHYNYTSES